MSDVLWIREPKLIRVRRLKNELTAAWKNDATITCQVRGLDGTAVGDPAPLAYVDASNGEYVGTIPTATTTLLTAATTYLVELAAAGVMFRQLRATAQVRSNR